MAKQLQEMLNGLSDVAVEPADAPADGRLDEGLDGSLDGGLSARAKEALDKLLASDVVPPGGISGGKKSKGHFGPHALMDILVRDGLCGGRVAADGDAGAGAGASAGAGTSAGDGAGAGAGAGAGVGVGASTAAAEGTPGNSYEAYLKVIFNP